MKTLCGLEVESRDLRDFAAARPPQRCRHLRLCTLAQQRLNERNLVSEYVNCLVVRVREKWLKVIGLNGYDGASIASADGGQRPTVKASLINPRDFRSAGAPHQDGTLARRTSRLGQTENCHGRRILFCSTISVRVLHGKLITCDENGPKAAIQCSVENGDYCSSS